MVVSQNVSPLYHKNIKKKRGNWKKLEKHLKKIENHDIIEPHVREKKKPKNTQERKELKWQQETKIYGF